MHRERQIEIRRLLHAGHLNAPGPRRRPSLRAWAAERLTVKVRRAPATLAEANNCREVEAAASKIRPLGKRIADAANKCSDEQCITKHSQPPEIDRELELALCPLYPFC